MDGAQTGLHQPARENAGNVTKNGADWRGTLFSTLQQVKSPFTFAVGGQLAVPGLLNLKVEGIGRIAFPLCPQQAGALAAVAHKAPYGKGAETVVDEDVRRAWQVDAEKVSVGDMLRNMVKQAAVNVAKGLGIGAAELGMEARLYKLLLYEAGGHFKPHRDTEKEEGMFGTLIVQLQAGHEGGALVVTHKGESKTFAFADGSEEGVFYAAFFADCEHKLEKVTSGHRLCLVYNLVRTTNGPAPQPADFTSARAAVLKAVRKWEADPSAPEKVALQLEHSYTPTNLSFRGLKGRDRSVVDVLRGVVEDGLPLVEVHLAMVTKHVVGSADGGYHYSRSRWFCHDESDDENATMCDIHETTIETEKKWVTVDDAEVDLGLTIDQESEVLGHGQLFKEHDEPDDREYEGYMGNYGPTLQYWYHRAMVVIWPRSGAFDVACSAGLLPPLGLAHRMLKNAEAGSLDMLERVVAFITQSWDTMRRREEGDVCTSAISAVAQGGPSAEKLAVDLLAAMARPVESKPHPDALICPVAKICVGETWLCADAPKAKHVVGISSESVAAELANLMQVMRSKTVSDALCELLARCPREQMLHWIALAQAMASQKPVNPYAARVADEVSTLVLKEDFRKLATNEFLAVLSMHFIVEAGDSSTRLQNLLSKYKDISTHQLCAVLSHCLSLGDVITSRPVVMEHVTALAKSFFDASWEGLDKDAVCKAAEMLSRAQSKPGGEDLFCNFTGVALTKSKAGHVSESLLSALLQQPCMRTDAASHNVQALIAHRLEQLSQYSVNPEFSWRQPQATFPGHYPQVQAFLRGPEQCTTISGVFNGIAHARNFANKYFGSTKWLHDSGGNYYAKAEALGIGRGACCKLTKTKGAYRNLLKEYEQRRKEAVGLRSLVANAGGSCKRRRVEVPEGEVIVLD
eukprot:evm.model.scf_314EXC.6 EVM.evm.TU.scf_314EXC.6   scf_314EXC:28582-31329(-)